MLLSRHEGIYDHLGHLCQWKSEIFNAQDNQGERCKWLQLSCSIYNYFFDEFEDDRGLIVTDWLVGTKKNGGCIHMEDLVERIIYAAITINVYQKKSKTGDFLKEPETQGNSLKGIDKKTLTR